MIKKIIGKIWKIVPFDIFTKAVRSVQNKFTASVVAIVTNEKGEILVLDHYFRPGASWGLPGGFINYDENTVDAIKREIKEETDLDIEDIKLIRVRTIGSHLEILFTAKSSGNPKVNSSEINEAGWFALDKLPEKMSKSQKKLLEKMFSKKF